MTTDKTEREQAVELANRVLDKPYIDPDGDICLLARQFLRAIEAHSGDGTKPRFACNGCNRPVAASEIAAGKEVCKCGGDFIETVMDEHERFEEWAKGQPAVLFGDRPPERSTYHDGYIYGPTDLAWAGWKARASSQPSVPPAKEPK